MQASRFARLLALALGIAAAPAAWCVALQTQPSQPVLQAPAATLGRAVVASGPAKRVEAAKPAWNELTPAQKQALAPLVGAWGTMSDAQRRKWLALSKNYPKLPQPEQAKLHSRMTEWAALSPQQRTQARLNFAETQTLAPQDKKAKWEAYQALPAEEKRKLGAGAAAKTPTTAAAVKPVPAQKLANVPKSRPDAKSPRIAAGPAFDGAAPHGNPAVVPAGPN